MNLMMGRQYKHRDGAVRVLQIKNLFPLLLLATIANNVQHQLSLLRREQKDVFSGGLTEESAAKSGDGSTQRRLLSLYPAH